MYDGLSLLLENCLLVPEILPKQCEPDSSELLQQREFAGNRVSDFTLSAPDVGEPENVCKALSGRVHTHPGWISNV